MVQGFLGDPGLDGLYKMQLEIRGSGLRQLMRVWLSSSGLR